MKYLSILFIFILFGCVQVPRNELSSQRLKTLPKYRANNTAANGSIYQAIESEGYYQSMFEDSRPKNVGDMLIVELKEDFSASHSASTSDDGAANQAQQTQEQPAASPSFWDSLFGDTTEQAPTLTNVAVPSPSDASAQNAYNGIIAVTVSNVLPNGNLEVIGERKITISKGTKVLRFLGTVNPKNINSNNTVTSTLIANARVEYVDDVKMVTKIVADQSFIGWWKSLFSSSSQSQAE